MVFKDQMVSRIYNRGLTTTSGGNLSILDEKRRLMDYAPQALTSRLMLPDITCATKEGQIIGKHNPLRSFTIGLFTTSDQT